MKVCQAVVLLLGVLSPVCASSPGAETCDASSGEHCAATQAALSQMEAEASEEAADMAVNLLAMRPSLSVQGKTGKTGMKRVKRKVQEKVHRYVTHEQKKKLKELEEAKKTKKTTKGVAKVEKKSKPSKQEGGATAKQSKKTEQSKETKKRHQGLSHKMQHLAEFVEQTSGNAALAAEAHHIEADLASGGIEAVEDDPVAEAEVVDLLDQESTEVSPQEAAEDGMEFTNDDMTELHHGVNMEAVNTDTFQGDMMPGSEEQLLLFQKIEGKHSTYAWAGTPWPGGVVPYCLSSDLPANAVKAWQLSLEQFGKAVPCLTFQDVGYESGTSLADGRCQERGAIFVQANPTDGCWSYVGKIDHPNQPLQIASPGCDSVATTMHEIAHALGMAHEQARPDRDEYVTIDFDNTEDDPQFTISENGDTKRPYDILSLMHYGVGDFATDKSRPVITVKPKGYEKYTTDPAQFGKYEIGSRIGLSQTDVDSLADMYNNEVEGGCKAMQLNDETTCADKLKDGEPFADGYGDCDKYRATSTADDPCSRYSARPYCCGCGGGWAVQSYGDVGVPVVPVPAPTLPPPPPPPVADPVSGSSDCRDSLTYTDPEWDETCASWADFGCDGLEFSEDLERNCPVACKVCEVTTIDRPGGCIDSTTYVDPVFEEGCPLWAEFGCDGFPFSAELESECPLACRKC